MKVDARRRLGASDVQVSALGFGGAALGNLYAPVSEEAARSTVVAALDVGIAHFDTAPYYGYGLSEQRLGRALGGVARDRYTLSTKVGRRLLPRDGPARSDQGFVDANRFDAVFDYSRDGVMRSFESSLERLCTDRIDVVLLHDVGAFTHGVAQHPEVFATAMGSGFEALRALRDSGAVGAIGLGVNECEVCIEALERVELDCLLLAGRYTLLEQSALDRLLPLCEARGTSLIVGGPFNSGILVEGKVEGKGDRPHYDYDSAPDEVVERVDRIRAICRAHDVPLPAAALQFPLQHPAVACVVPGMRHRDEVRANAMWFERTLPSALYRDLLAAGLLHPRSPVGTSE